MPLEGPVERLSEQDYFEVGLALLAEGGIAAVTIANLCDRLGVTKGSFYHHFAGGPDFQQRLLTYWSADRAGQLIATVEATPDPYDRITLLKRIAVDLQHEAESAIRAWARSDSRAAEVQRRVDAGRTRALTEAFIDAGVPRRKAPTLAQIGLTILIGTQQQSAQVDRKRLAAMFDEYQAWLEASMVLPGRRSHSKIS
jgi:AcrR family transcriptional regulator